MRQGGRGERAHDTAARGPRGSCNEEQAACELGAVFMRLSSRLCCLNAWMLCDDCRQQHH